MTMLTYAHSPAQDCGSESKARRDIHAAGRSTAGSNLIKRAGRFVFAVTLVTAALAGIVALDASIYLARFSH